MPNNRTAPHSSPVPPPNKHQLALMIWLAVFPTLTLLNLALGDWLRTLSPVLRTFHSRYDRSADRHIRPHAAPASAARQAGHPRRLSATPDQP